MLQETTEEELTTVGVSLNRSKQENVIEGFNDGGEAWLFTNKELDGAAVWNARYLGGRHVRGNLVSEERELRIMAARRGWAILLKSWNSATPLRFRIIAFGCMVQGAALSGLEACTNRAQPLSERDVKPIDALLCNYTSSSQG